MLFFFFCLKKKTYYDIILYKNIIKGEYIIKKFFKNLLSSVICGTVCMSIFSINVKADEVKKITLLGDSITTGFGLSEAQLNYGEYLESYFDAQVDNFAENGLTTEGQLEKLEQSEIEESIKESDMICISIGGNDLLHVFEDALTQYDSANGNIFENGGNLSAASGFVESFIMNYSSALGAAVTDASENIEEIKNKIYEINPDANLIMQTIYIPFESADENLNKVLKSLNTFSSIFVGTINNAIKSNSENVADINLKFSEKPYLYTNIDSFDIHPNYLGHMLIAEEIIQTTGLPGNEEIFKEASDNITHGVFSEMPQYISLELDEFSNGNLRSCTLEEEINNSKQALANNLPVSEADSQASENSRSESAEQTEKNMKENENQNTNKTLLSRIFLIIGVALILFVTAFNYIKKRRKNK